MIVKMLADHSETLDRMATKTWPKDWSGPVDDKIGATMVKLGKAVEVKSDPPLKVELTDAQKTVLAGAANRILANEAAKKAYDEAAATVTAVHPETGEPLEDLKVDDLRELATQLGIEAAAVAKLKKADVIETIVARMRDLVGTQAAELVLAAGAA